MPYFAMSKCPVCDKTAYRRNEIEKEFGYRYYGTVPQSLCRKYRRSDSRGRYKDCRFWEDDYSRDMNTTILKNFNDKFRLVEQGNLVNIDT